jgi:hypothetical protein
MTDKRLAELEKLCATAWADPWRVGLWKFSAEARTALPELLTTVKAQAEEIARLRAENRSLDEANERMSLEINGVPRPRFRRNRKAADALDPSA